jgi:hypothetical protein
MGAALHHGYLRMANGTLPPLPGTAPDESWRIGNADRDLADGRLAIFGIVARSPETPPNLRGNAPGRLLGTGFYLLTNGGFATARHVAEEALEAMAQSEHTVGLIYALPGGLLVYRPIWKFFLHPTADLAFGIPHEIIDNSTGMAFRAKVLSLEREPPPLGAPISTWAYPLHTTVQDSEGHERLYLQPAFYDGFLQEVFEQRGPSGKLNPPYYLTTIHLYGGSSGGPVFNTDGHVFGVASSSYDGMEDVAFVTPIRPIFDLELHDIDMKDGRGRRIVTVREIANIGRIVVRG